MRGGRGDVGANVVRVGSQEMAMKETLSRGRDTLGIQWMTGEVTELRTPTATSRALAIIRGDNGTTYTLKENGFAPEDRAHGVRVGQRVKFEDRQGYVLDLRHI